MGVFRIGEIPVIHDEVANWWYHYYSKGENVRISSLCPSHFTLSDRKCTPDFENLTYEYGICHPQIGETVTPTRSIVLMKTTIGCTNPAQGCLSKSPYIVGYFRVEKVDKKRGIIWMDPNDSLLLLNSPIELDANLAKELFPNKPSGYWDRPEIFVRRVGSTLRNKKATAHELKIVLSKLISQSEQGTLNFLGKRI